MRTKFMILACVLPLITLGQTKRGDRVTVDFRDVELKVILDTLSDQTNYFFSYNSEVLPKGSRFTIAKENFPIDQFLSQLFIGTGLTYSFYKDQIILKYEPPQKTILKKKFFSITGTVFDEQGKPLSDVNVFLDGTTIGISTDIDGNYKLEFIPSGFYNLVFSHVGYENGEYQTAEYNGGARIQNHTMVVDLGQLEEVEVISNRIKSTEISWFEHYQTFKQELIGQSENAKNCIIENPEVLDFSYKKETNTLKAFTEGALQIRNEVLGYRVSYYLESFEKQQSNLRFRGKMRFSNLTPTSRRERRAWRRNRKESYYGSFNHFRKSLLEGELKKEGFRLYKIKNLDKLKTQKENALSVSDIIAFKGDYYELEFKNHLVVVYKKEKESARFLLTSDFSETFYKESIKNGLLNREPGNQISIIKLLRGSVRLDLSGEIMDRFGITKYGYWSWERTADLVPLNYDPKFDNL